jgi:ABC-type lipoprotein export system ATPase subunit
LQSGLRKTILMVTHDPRAAERAARQVHLEKGLLVEATPPTPEGAYRDLAAQAAHAAEPPSTNIKAE